MDNIEKKDTISIISHELRTSLIATKWVLKMLLDEDLGEINEKQKLFIEKTIKNNDKMVELVSELIEAGHSDSPTPLSFETTNIVPIGLDTLKDFGADAKKRGITLEYAGPTSGIVSAEINKNKIHSAIQELLHNALKYTEKGFVRLSIAEHGGQTIEIKVEDSGIGISPIEQTKVFEKFWRGETAKKKEEIGSGLGLFAVAKIVEKHGGEVSCTSEENKGSTFTMTLPKKQ